MVQTVLNSKTILLKNLYAWCGPSTVYLYHVFALLWSNLLNKFCGMESFSRSVLRTCSIDIHKSGCNLTGLKFLQLLYQIFNALRSKDSFNSVLFRCPKYVLASLQNDLISSIQIGSFLPPFTRTNSVTLNRLEALP